MKKDLNVTIPLISFSIGREGWGPDHERGEKFFESNNYTRISPKMELPDRCYGVKIDFACQSLLLQLGSLAIFSKTEGIGLEDIYVVGVQGGYPFLGKWVQKDSLKGAVNSRRKAFMVPTPMHLPDSRISPIAQSLHHVLFFKDFSGSGKLRLIPTRKILWKHPMIYVQKE